MTVPMDCIALNEMHLRMFRVVLELARRQWTTATIQEEVSNGWHFMEISSTTTMSWDNVKEVRDWP